MTKWLLFCQEGVISTSDWMFSSEFNNIALLSDPKSAVSIANIFDYCDDPLVLSTLLYKKNGRELSTVGAVREDWSLTIHQDVFPNIKFGFNGRELVVSTNMWPPYVYSREVNGSVEYYGFCMDLAYELSRTMNFTIRWVEPPDGNWGAVDANGSWNGLVGQMQREEIDLIIAPIGVTGAREEVIDFTSAFFYDDTAVILKMPDPNKSKWRTYIDIFRQEVLMCIGIALMVGSVILFLLTKAERVMYGNQYKTSPRPEFTALHHMMKGFYKDDPDILHNDANVHLEKVKEGGYAYIADKGLFSFWLATNCDLILLKEKFFPSKYAIGLPNNSVYTKIFSDQICTEECVPGVKEGGYAYIADKGLFSFWLATNCDLILLKEKFFPSKYAIGLPNNSVYTKIFSDQVGKIYESGLLQVWVKQWWPKQTFCSGSLLTQARTLNLMDVQSSFYVLAIGIGLAGLVLGAETGFTLLRQGLKSSTWAQAKIGTAKGWFGKILGCIEGGGGNGSVYNSSPNKYTCDVKETTHAERRENGVSEANGCQDGRNHTEFRRQNGRRLSVSLGNNKPSDRYEIRANYAVTFKDIYSNRGYIEDSTEFQNGSSRISNPKHATSDFTNISNLSHEDSRHNGLVNGRDRHVTKRKGDNRESFEIEVYDNTF
ncbi:hypothetical protein EGW08_013491 [Elysia chlorotica]|uniref:Ionotropic glutamate receptor L-glutamate and glycine-binding domain-containing protein n=1 Tax=Elysia chlorotica TaxID=188477 RepID=A0A3S1HG77_ELYCH|nr:hypothetical protein EGW08_013491 [Elysia chlorotica]